MGVCDICGGKVGFLTGGPLKDGKYCGKCLKRFGSIGLAYGDTWYSNDYTVEEVKSILENPYQWKNEIETRTEQRNQQQKQQKEQKELLKAQNQWCLVCGKKRGLMDYGSETSDGRGLCIRCAMAAITTSPQEYVRYKNRYDYITMHDSSFFLENMAHIEHPHPGVSVNFTKKCFYWVSDPAAVSDVTLFESIVKFETDVNQYEVTAGKKGHPIARAAAGGMVFGPAGAVVGAMTAKDTRHRETKTGNRYVNIYYKDSSQKSGINKKTLESPDDLVIVKLEECLKRVFEAVNEDNEANGANVQEEPKSAEYGKLVELKNLLDMGIITSEEFDQKKRQILGL